MENRKRGSGKPNTDTHLDTGSATNQSLPNRLFNRFYIWNEWVGEQSADVQSCPPIGREEGDNNTVQTLIHISIQEGQQSSHFPY